MLWAYDPTLATETWEEVCWELMVKVALETFFGEASFGEKLVSDSLYTLAIGYDSLSWTATITCDRREGDAVRKHSG